MTKCPGCKKELDHLDLMARETWYYPTTVNGVDYDKGIESDYEEEPFYCPHCSYEFDLNLSEVVDFLKGELEVDDDA